MKDFEEGIIEGENMSLYQQFPLCFILLAIVTLSGCETFKDVFDIHSGEIGVETEDGYIRAVFSDKDRRAIRKYYAKKRKGKGLPPGLAKRDRLPPGLQKRLDAGEPLPPGLQGRGLPDELEEILSPLPKGYVRLKVGGNVVILDQKTEIVIDIVKDINEYGKS